MAEGNPVTGATASDTNASDTTGPNSSGGHGADAGASSHAAGAAGAAHRASGPALVLAALGIVFGDISTSPLYALQTVFSIDHGAVKPTQGDVYGVISLIFWSVTLIVSIKYVMVIMRADNDGEGGVMALAALARRLYSGRTKHTGLLVILGIVGVSLFYGDSLITPAISVLSAVEGLKVAAPSLGQYVVPAAAVILTCLFAAQRFGTGKVGALFGPITVLWLAALAAAGLREVSSHPSVIKGLSPTYGVLFVTAHPRIAFVAMGAIVLVITGAEALYADMGHFGRQPILRAWFFVVFPALVLNYLGQASLILHNPEADTSPFFLLLPGWARLPMVVLATAATVIASQAMITGAYSIARQAVQLGYLPRMRVSHTNPDEEGQIYVPQVNRALMVGVLLLVLAFRSSDALASAYGIAVTGTFMCTCILAMVVFRRQYGWPRFAAVGVFGGFFLIDGVFFAANALKIPQGGWVPLLLGIVLTALMTSWKRGRELLALRWKQDSMPLASFLARLPQSRTVRVPGMAVFLTGNPDIVPASLLHNLKHNKVLHENVLFVTIQNLDQPEAGQGHRLKVEELAPGVHRVFLRYGFMESPNIPRGLEELGAHGVDYNAMQASFFLGREVRVRAMVPKLPAWRLFLFLFMARNAVPATEFFRIPSDRVVELGVRVAI